MIESVKQNAPAIIVVAAIIAFVGFLFFTANKQSSDKTPEIEVGKTDDEAASKTKTPKQYTSTAALGDSYTVMARKAIQSYAKSSDTQISKAQIIAAETTLTQLAGSPELEIGQKVELKATDVSKAVSSAKALSAEQLALWETYVPYVVF